MSALTQPPVYVLALTQLMVRGIEVDPWVLQTVSEAMEWLWQTRLSRGLLTVVHPWETGADISPRFDDWYGPIRDFDTVSLNHHYQTLMKSVTYASEGTAISNARFLVAPSGFNAIAADAAQRLGQLTDQRVWTERYEALSAQIDRQLWDEDQGIWVDRPDVPGSRKVRSSSIPTIDGVLAALGTKSVERATRALKQCVGDGRFAAPFGPRYLPSGHPSYLSDVYWRGPTWPQLNYLLVVAARSHGLSEIASELVATTIRGVWSSGFAEYWNPETGEGRGAIPQSWATIALAL